MNIKYDIIYNYVISNKIKGSEANISSRKRGSIATAQCFLEGYIKIDFWLSELIRGSTSLVSATSSIGPKCFTALICFVLFSLSGMLL